MIPPGSGVWPLRPGQVTRIVDLAHGGVLISVPLDLVDAGRAEIEAVHGEQGDAKGPAEQDLDGRDVAHHENGLTWIFLQDPRAGAVHPARGSREALSARRRELRIVL